MANMQGAIVCCCLMSTHAMARSGWKHKQSQAIKSLYAWIR